MRADFADRYGPWAVVTGASSGIGAELARQLGRAGLGVVLAARRRDRLDSLAADLAAAHGCAVRAVEADLGSDAGIEALTAATASLDVGLVVLNAGFGWKGPLVDEPLAPQLEMVALNCRSTLALAHHYAGRLAARGRGGLVITSSTAAFQGTPYTTAYGATKRFGLGLAEGLWEELAPRGVDVVALCPGPTDTEGPRRTGVDPSTAPVRFMAVEPVARAALDALGRTPIVVPGPLNALGVALTRLVPRRYATRTAGRLMRRAMGVR